MTSGTSQPLTEILKYFTIQYSISSHVLFFHLMFFFLVATDTCMRWWNEKGIVFYGKLWIRILLQILIIDFLLFLVMPEFCARKLSYKIQPF